MKDSCRRFVQDFYDWYVSLLPPFPETLGPSDLILRNHRKAQFSGELLRLLIADQSAQQRNHGNAGLTFDPFLNSRLPSPRFVSTSATYTNGACLVEMRGMDGDQPIEKVKPELVRHDGAWQFVNFHYTDYESPSRENLLSTLQDLRASRQKAAAFVAGP